MPNPLIESLSRLGIGENEAVLYKILLKTPDATIAELQKKSDFSRTMLYHIVGNLEALGLVTPEKTGSKTAFTAEPPEKLHDFLKSREEDLARQKNSLAQTVAALSSEYRLAHNKPGIRYFEGRDGFAEALDDTLSSQEPIYSFVDVDALQKYAADINAEHVKRRRTKKIQKQILMQDTPAARAFIEQLGPEQTEVRLLPRDLKPFHTGMQIYDGKISYFTLRENNIMAIIISDPDIYAMNRSMFEYWWKKASAPTPTAGPTAFRSE